MYRIRRFNVVRTANVVAVMYMAIVAIFVIPIAIFALLVGAFAGAQGAVPEQAQRFLVGTVVVGLFAIFGYGLAGWVITAIAAYIYNIVAAWVGGIEVQVEPVAPPPALPDWMGAPPRTPPS